MSGLNHRFAKPAASKGVHWFESSTLRDFNLKSTFHCLNILVFQRIELNSMRFLLVNYLYVNIKLNYEIY